MIKRQVDPRNIVIGKNLKLFIDARGFTQAEVAKMAGMTPGHLTLLIQGKRGWSLKNKMALSETLNVHHLILENHTELDKEKVSILLGVLNTLSLPKSDPDYVTLKNVTEKANQRFPKSPKK